MGASSSNICYRRDKTQSFNRRTAVADPGGGGVEGVQTPPPPPSLLEKILFICNTNCSRVSGWTPFLKKIPPDPPLLKFLDLPLNRGDRFRSCWMSSRTSLMTCLDQQISNPTIWTQVRANQLIRLPTDWD